MRAGGWRRATLQAAAVLALSLEATAALAQSAAPTTQTSPETQPVGSKATSWEFYGDFSGYFFFQGGEGDYLQPTVSADHGAWHLEARYNYEERDTASLWGGWNLSFGKNVTLDLTPMLGVVFGDADGIAPGMELTLTWKSLVYYGESEYFFDTEDHESNYFYAWTEVSWQQPDWLRYGLAMQRTRAYQSSLDFQIGPMAGFSVGKIEIAAYYFNPTHEEAFAVLTASIEF